MNEGDQRDRGRVAGLVLAAGAGTRLGRPKALVEVGGERLVDRALRLLVDGGCAPLFVVAGAVGLVDLDVPARVVVNPDWPSGMASSLRRGLAALQGNADAAVVTLVDTALVSPLAVSRLVAAWQSGAIAAVAYYAGKPRNPVLLDESLWPEVSAAATGDLGARAWLRAHPDRVTPIACDDAGSPYDVDTPDELVRLEEDLA